MTQTKAKRRAEIAPAEQPKMIADAITNLTYARDYLRMCGCKRAADYAARALKSAQGAKNHADRMARQ